jgi:glyoxylase-like metal-dependent hydrolase (beta-lactamase superfamily II)
MPQIAGYELYTIETGRFALDGGAMFGIVPKPLWERYIPADAQNRIPLVMRCLLLVGNGRVILVDNGLGDKYDAKFAHIYSVDNEHSSLNASLKQAGFSADEVTDVVLTHLHFDHCGGSTIRKGEQLVTAFSNATYHVQQDHWEWTKKPNARERNSFLKENLEPLAASGQLHLLEGDDTLFDGVSVKCYNGHTQAMQTVKITDDTSTLVFAADLLPTSAHLLPAWVMAYDLLPLTSIDEKAEFLHEAIENNWQIMFEHDPTVEISSLKRDAKGHIIPENPRKLESLAG